MSKYTLSIGCETPDEVRAVLHKLHPLTVEVAVGAAPSTTTVPAEELEQPEKMPEQAAPRPRGRPPKAKTEEPKPTPPPPVAPEKPKPAAEKPKLKDTDVRAKLAEVAEKFSPNEARAIIKGFATNITELKPADYQAVYDAAMEKLGPADADQTQTTDDEDFLK
jgi:hypothetical protein